MTEFDDVLVKIKEWKDKTSEILLELAEEVPNLDHPQTLKFLKLAGQNEVYRYFLTRAVGGKFNQSDGVPVLMDPEAEDKVNTDTSIYLEKLWSDTSSRDDWFRKDSEKFFKDWRQRVMDNFSSIAQEADAIILKQLGIRDGIDRMTMLTATSHLKDSVFAEKIKELDDIAQQNNKELDKELPQLTKQEKIQKKTNAVYDSLNKQAEALGIHEYEQLKKELDSGKITGNTWWTGGVDGLNYPQAPHEDYAAWNDGELNELDDIVEAQNDEGPIGGVIPTKGKPEGYDPTDVAKIQNEELGNICPTCGLDKRNPEGYDPTDVAKIQNEELGNICPNCGLDKRRL